MAADGTRFVLLSPDKDRWYELLSPNRRAGLELVLPSLCGTPPFRVVTADD